MIFYMSITFTSTLFLIAFLSDFIKAFTKHITEHNNSKNKQTNYYYLPMRNWTQC